METPSDLYYLCVPHKVRSVSQKIDFLPVQQFLEDDESCKRMWEMITANFRTRSKFLAIWPAVRFVAICKDEGKLAGFLLVSAAVNWQIDYVTVNETMRGRGIAEALVNETLNQALARHAPYVMLTSRENLRGLYEGRCGFTVVAKSEFARLSHSETG